VNLLPLKRPGLARIVSNSGWLIGEQVVHALVSLGIGIWLARFLGPEAFGQFSFALALVSVFAIVATLGLNRIVVRELVARAGDAMATRSLMSTVFAMRLAATFAAFMACAVASWLFGLGEAGIVALVAASLMFRAPDCVDLYFQSITASRVTASAKTVAFLIASLIRVILLVAGAELWAFAAMVVLEAALSSMALLWVYGARADALRPRPFDAALARRLIKESSPEILAGFAGLMLMRLDQLMLEALRGPAEVGVYSVASRLAESWYFVVTAIVASTFPAIVRQRERDASAYMLRLSQLMVGLVGIAYFVIALATIVAKPIVNLLFGTDYAAAAGILIVLIWSGLFVCLGAASGSWIMAEGKVRLNLYRHMLAVSVNVALNALLIPAHGGLGAAVATLTALAVAYLGFDFVRSDTRAIGRLKLWALLLVARAPRETAGRADG
jgi:O-antigen/teichoic acid export membrane protein